MSRPPLNPEKSVAGIALDPQTLERVIPESKRPDGTFRKQIKIRPGFTPQEDVRRFRGTKQAQMDSNALPKGHIIGWAPPPNTSAAASGSNGTKPLSKSAKKNAKRKEKREKEKSDTIPDNWDEEDEEKPSSNTSAMQGTGASENASSTSAKPSNASKTAILDVTNALVTELEKLDVN